MNDTGSIIFIIVLSAFAGIGFSNVLGWVINQHSKMISQKKEKEQNIKELKSFVENALGGYGLKEQLKFLTQASVNNKAKIEELEAALKDLQCAVNKMIEENKTTAIQSDNQERMNKIQERFNRATTTRNTQKEGYMGCWDRDETEG